MVRVAGRDCDRLRISPLTVKADHLAVIAELFSPSRAVIAVTAGDEVVEAYSITDLMGIHCLAYCLHSSRYFVPGDQWKRRDRTGTGFVVNV